MQTLKQLAIGLVVLVLILVGGSYLLPQQVCVERSLVIRAPREVIAAHVTDLKKWDSWSPWAKLDPKMKVKISDPSSGVGAWMAWDSEQENVGKGKMTLTVITPDSCQQMMDYGMGEPAMAAFYFLPTEGGTQVRWTGHFEMGNNPMGRWMGLFLDGMVGKDYEKGLANLAKVSEQ